MNRSTFVIAGASLAGGTAADTLRREGFDGRIVMLGAEPDPPYERPPLSKEYLRRESPREAVFLNKPEYYGEQRIELRLGQRVSGLDPGEKRLTLESGEQLAYDKLLLATGSKLRELRLPGADLEGVLYLRTLRDSDRLGDLLQRQPRLLVIGAGFIGAEVAASARMTGCEVTMLEAAPVPLIKALGEQMGAHYAGFHRRRGVDLRTGVSAIEFRGGNRLEEAVLATGEVIGCDVALIGVGVAPSVDFLEGSGVEMQNGVLADEFSRTNVPDVFAAGDVANWWHPVWKERLRLEHYDNAINQGMAVAKSMLGRGEPYAPVPYFWSDQYDLNLQYLGFAARWDEIAVRGEPSEEKFSAFYVVGGKVRACLTVNRAEDQRYARKLIESGAAVDVRKLSDEDVALKQLVA